jgi:hypothetical protein
MQKAAREDGSPCTRAEGTPLSLSPASASTPLTAQANTALNGLPAAALQTNLSHVTPADSRGNVGAWGCRDVFGDGERRTPRNAERGTLNAYLPKRRSLKR